MSATPVPVSTERPESPGPLTVGRVAGIIWESLWEALVLAFLVQLTGKIAWDIISSIAGPMIPSAPPVFAESPETLPASWRVWQGFFNHHHYAILVAVVFLTRAGVCLSRYSPSRWHRHTAARLGRVFERLSENWFSLLVMNAIGAFVAATICNFAAGFSWKHFVAQALLAWFHPAFEAFGRFVPGSDLLSFWFSWYNQNQLKFTFWFFYVAGICDDLGLPNFKTLGRWWWRRYFGGSSGPARARAEASESPQPEASDGVPSGGDAITPSCPNGRATRS